MTNAFISHLGVPNGGTPTSPYSDDKYQQFYEQFAGQLLTAFDETHKFGERHLVRNISNQKSARFPATWKAEAAYHIPGTPALGNNRIASNKRTIHVDGSLMSHIFIDDLEEAMNEYEVRSEYAKQIGQALAREYDSRVGQVIIRAARESGTIPGKSPGGTTLTHADAKTDAEKLTELVFTANQTFDEKDVPEMERYCAVLPAQYYMLVQSEKVQNTRFGGHGMMMRGEVPYIGPASIVMTNNLPQTNIASSIEGEKNDYTGDFTNVAAAVWHKTAVGTVKLKDVQTQMTDPDGDIAVVYQGVIMNGKYACGHGILRPECAVEITTA